MTDWMRKRWRDWQESNRQLLSPVQHRSAQAQIRLKAIRAQAGLVSARTALINGALFLPRS